MMFRRISGLLLNVVYTLVFLLAIPWLLWRFFRYGKNRRGWSHKLGGSVPLRKPRTATDAENSAPLQPSVLPRCVWLHAVSVGEVNLLAPIIERIQRDWPDVDLVLSTTTETGYDLACKKYPSLHSIFFFPFDFTWSVKRALQRIRPSLIVLAELEIWPNLIAAASDFPRNAGSPRDRGIPLAVINGRLSESSLRGYLRFRWLLKSSFKKLSLVAAQDPTYAHRFLQVGCQPGAVVVTGSVKFDGIQTDRQNDLSLRLKRLARIDDNEFVFLAGSTQVEEDLLAAAAYQELQTRHNNLRLILAPRHPERCDDLVEQLQRQGLPVVRRSTLLSTDAESEHALNPNANRILIVDVIGELGGWWGVADVAYVGGSMGKRGGQNMIEPAAYGIPVSFGPHTSNFRQTVQQLLGANGAQVVHDQAELTRFVEQCLTNPTWARQLGTNAQTEVLKHRGASERTLALLSKLMLESIATPCSVA